MVGIIAAGMGLGTMIMTPIANQLIQTHGWRSSYIIVGVGGIICISILAQLLRNPVPGDMPTNFRRTKSSKQLELHGASVSLRSALKSGQLWLLCAICLLWGGLSLTIFVHIVPHVIDLGFSATQAASVLSVLGGVVFGAKIILGIVIDKIGSKRAFLIALGAMSIGLFWLLFSKELWTLYLFAIIFSFGYAGGSVVMPTIAAEIFGLGAHGSIFGVINFSACCGVAIGPMAVGWLFDQSGNYQVAICLMVGFSILSLLMTFGIRKSSQHIFGRH